MKAPRVWDTVVIGAGPAGSTTAALLAAGGFDVLLLDKDEFPRFRIGESLLPSGLPVLDKLGIKPTDDTFQFKRGAEFVCEATRRTASFDFAQALAGPPRHAWHVERASFDAMLRDKAGESGAVVRHGVSATDVQADEEGASVDTTHGKERARFVVDATGQERLIGRRRRAVKPYGRFGKAAVYAHFSGMSDEAVETIGPGNDIRIMMVDGGWLWVIPLPGRRLSVGLVTQRRGMTVDDFQKQVATSPLLRCLTDGTEATKPQIVSNFSYHNDAHHGTRYACVGDAACFLDPVFSSGVSLALIGACSLVERLGPALDKGTEGAAEFYAPLSHRMQQGYRAFALLIHRFYNTRLVDNVVLDAPPDGVLRASITSMLAGDVWGKDNSFKDMLLRSRIQL